MTLRTMTFTAMQLRLLIRITDDSIEGMRPCRLATRRLARNEDLHPDIRLANKLRLDDLNWNLRRLLLKRRELMTELRAQERADA